MADRLAVYLNDHLAGSRFAVDLLERLHDAYADKPLGNFAAELLRQINEDRVVLQRIIDGIDSEGSTLKEAAAWMAEKASRLKLRLGADEEFTIFEALETLSLGIMGKLALWRALAAAAESDHRLSGIDFNSLSERALDQHAHVEAQRLTAAKNAFRQPPTT